MNLFTDIPLHNKDDVYNAVIEIPKNSRIKYEYDDKLGTMVVDRVLRTPVDYPQNYGFFPRTWNKYDNDPMDVIVISSESFHPGIMVPVRIVGIIEMDDTGEFDHKILSVPTGHSDYHDCKDITDLDSELLANIEWFLANYKSRKKGGKITILGKKGAKDAIKFLEECSAEYKEHHEK